MAQFKQAVNGGARTEGFSAAASYMPAALQGAGLACCPA